MENEIMNYEEEVMEPEVEVIETEAEESGNGMGVGMLIGAGITLAFTAAVKLGKKLWNDHKAKKETCVAETHDFVEPTDEEIEAVTNQ